MGGMGVQTTAKAEGLARLSSIRCSGVRFGFC